MMKCSKCGAVLPDDAKFCGACGSALEESGKVEEVAKTEEVAKAEEVVKMVEEPKQQPKADVNKSPKEKKKSGWVKKILALVAVAVVAVLVVKFVFLNGLTGSSAEKGHDIWACFDTDKKCILVGYDDGTFEIPADEVDEDTAYVGGVYCAQTAAVVTLYGSDEDNNSIYETYYVSGLGKYTKILDDSMCDIVTAADADAFCIIDADNTLILYNNGKDTTVADDVIQVCVSPDGKSVVYRVKEDSDDDSDEDVTEVFYYNGGESTKIGENLNIKSVSNDGKYIYAIDDDSDLYVFDSKGEKTKIGSGVMSDMLVTDDGASVMFSTGEKVFVSIKGEEKQKLMKADYVYGFSVVNTSTGSLDLDSFASRFYAVEGSLYYVDKKYETTKVCSSAVTWFATEDGKTLYYTTSSGYAYKYSASTQESEKILKDVYTSDYSSMIKASPNGKKVYYLNEDEELCLYNGKEVTIIDDTEDIVGLCCDEEGHLYYLCNYSSKSGTYDVYYYDKGERTTLIAEDVLYIRTGERTIRYATVDGDTCEVFVSTSGTKFKSLGTYGRVQ